MWQITQNIPTQKKNWDTDKTTKRAQVFCLVERWLKISCHVFCVQHCTTGLPTVGILRGDIILVSSHFETIWEDYRPVEKSKRPRRLTFFSLNYKAQASKEVLSPGAAIEEQCIQREVRLFRWINIVYSWQCSRCFHFYHAVCRPKMSKSTAGKSY